MHDTEIRVTNLDLLNSLKNHFEDDAKAFENINHRFEKSDSIAISNGRHMSDIRKDLTEVNVKIDKLVNTIFDTNSKLTKHIDSLEPILTDYQDTQATKRTIGKFVKPIVAFVLTLASFIGAMYVIINLINI